MRLISLVSIHCEAFDPTGRNKGLPAWPGVSEPKPKTTNMRGILNWMSLYFKKGLDDDSMDRECIVD